MSESHKARRDYCERVCRCASHLGAGLEERTALGLISFVFVQPGGWTIPGAPSSDRREALHSACKAFADTVL